MKSYTEYRIRPEFRRACWYPVAAFLLLPLGIYALQNSLGLEHRGIAEQTSVLMLFALAMLLVTIWAYWIRLRLDPRGLSVRWFIKWTTWNWDDFRTGKVERGPGLHQYHVPGKTKPERTLDLSLFPDEAIQECEGLIEAILKPAPILVPAALTIRYPKYSPFKREVKFGESGIWVSTKSGTRQMAWGEVREVIVRIQTLRHRGFTSLFLELPGRTILLEIHKKQHYPLFTGADPKVLREFIVRHVAAEKVVIVPQNGPPDSARAYQIAREGLRSRSRQNRFFLWAMGCGIMVITAARLWGIARNRESRSLWLPILIFGFLVGIFLIVVIGMYVSLRGLARDRERDLDKVREQFEGEEHTQGG